MHCKKTRALGDNRKSKEHKELLRKRDADTKKFVETIDVSDLLQFSEPLRDEIHGGYDFDLPQFLLWVRPHWQQYAIDISPKGKVEYTAPYTKYKDYGAAKA